jgi:transcriptional regulator of met regulon
MARRAVPFKRMPDDVQIAAFVKLLEETLRTQVENLREFCDSGENVELFIKALVAGDDLPRRKMIGGGDVRKKMCRQYVMNLAVRRGILTEARSQDLSPASMDSKCGSPRNLLTLLQAIVDKAGVAMLPYVSDDESSDRTSGGRTPRSSGGVETSQMASFGWEQRQELHRLEGEQEGKMKRLEIVLTTHRSRLQRLRDSLKPSADHSMMEEMQAVLQAYGGGPSVCDDGDPAVMQYNEIIETETRLNHMLHELGEEPRPSPQLINPRVLLRDISDLRSQVQVQLDACLVAIG